MDRDTYVQIRSRGQLLTLGFISVVFITSVLCIWGTAREHSIPEAKLPIFEDQLGYDLFLKRISILEPGLSGSLRPWNNSHSLDTSYIQATPLIRYPDMPKDDTIWCKLHKFGYTQEQADRYFNPSKKFTKCGNPNLSFMRIADNKLEIKCTAGLTPEYIVGTEPESETLGDMEYKGTWQKYEQPVDLGRSEYAFGRCTKSRKQAVFINKFSQAASDRANKRTQEIAKSLNATEVRPLSVYLVLFDSVSRQHFYRNFPETIKFLNEQFTTGKYKDKLTMYDFIINNAHGENTQPNMVPMLYGYNLEYHRKRLENYSIDRATDQWKFLELQQEALWKYYEKMGFVTMFGFDTVWDYLSRSTGRKILTDHMASNFWHACKKLYGYQDFVERQRCIGIHNSHYYMLDYIYQFTKNYEGHNRFGYTHISPAHESSGTVIRTADDDVKEFFEKMLDYYITHPNEDFVLMFASDHGKHSNEWDEEPEGYLENQLPSHIIFTNKELIARLGPDTDQILKHNTNRLVSRLDWHLTFKHLAMVPYGKLEKDSDLYNTWKQRSDSNKAISLFMEKVPDGRNCEDMNIPVYYCTCLDYIVLPIEIAKSSEPVASLVKLGIDSINNSIELDKATDFCMKVSLKEILKVEEKQFKEDEFGNRNYKIKFTVNEHPSAIFDMLGFMSNYEEFNRFSIDQKEGRFPVMNITYIGPLGPQAMSIQVQEIIRIDPYRGICEEIARSVGTNSGKCLCYNAQNTDFSVSLKPSQQKVFEDLKKKLYIKLGEDDISCTETCMSVTKTCQDWGLQLLNSEEMLEEPWLDDNSYYIDQTRRLSFKDFKISKIRREGNMLGVNEKNELVLAEWDKLSCDNFAKGIRAICTCT
jgi:hypothetical protein